MLGGGSVGVVGFPFGFVIGLAGGADAFGDEGNDIGAGAVGGEAAGQQGLTRLGEDPVGEEFGGGGVRGAVEVEDGRGDGVVGVGKVEVADPGGEALGLEGGERLGSQAEGDRIAPECDLLGEVFGDRDDRWTLIYQELPEGVGAPGFGDGGGDI